MSEWIFSFGSGQTHPCTGERLDNRFVAIEAESFELARREMNRRFARVWGDQYHSREHAGVVRYELRPLEGQTALGLARATPFYGWAWRVGLKLVSGQVILADEGECLLHRDAVRATERVAEDYHPEDMLVTVVEKPSALSAVVKTEPLGDGLADRFYVTLACGHAMNTGSRAQQITCNMCAREARDRSEGKDA